VHAGWFRKTENVQFSTDARVLVASGDSAVCDAIAEKL